MDRVLVNMSGNVLEVYAYFAQYNVKISYLYGSTEGEQACPAYYGMADSEGLVVKSPVLKDYAADKYIVTANQGDEITVVYTALENLSFSVDNGTESSSLEGEGSESNPYLISSAADYRYFATQVNGGNDFSGKYIRLEANVDMNGAAFSVGKSANPPANSDLLYTVNYAFAGTFDGNGHVLKGRNGSGAYNAYFGAITGTLKNLIVLGDINLTAGRLAGIVAVLKDGTVENCVNYVNITGTIVELGGIAAANWGGNVVGCVNYGSVTRTGAVTATNYTYGGIVAHNAGGGRVEDCVNYGTVTCSNGKQTGGIVGLNESGCSVLNCVNRGEVISSVTGDPQPAQASIDVGGIVGRNAGTIGSCSNYGNVTNSSGNRTGGIAGYCVGGTIDGCINYATVNGYSVVGGILGNAENNTPVSTVTNCKNYGNVSSTVLGVAGGIVGYAKGLIENCVNEGDVHGAGDLIGGIAGSIQMANGKVDGCTNRGTVTGGNYVGGIAGDAEQNGVCLNNGNYGNVSGTDCVGGVLGGIKG
ncbi:MAG: hypothetical protein ACI4SH_07165, partial [Candidatus Scatosoma sp.]